jgi:hypothetical protein
MFDLTNAYNTPRAQIARLKIKINPAVFYSNQFASSGAGNATMPGSIGAPSLLQVRLLRLVVL